jgi:translation elongation factor P/translation initiation factor 5A
MSEIKDKTVTNNALILEKSMYILRGGELCRIEKIEKRKSGDFYIDFELLDVMTGENFLCWIKMETKIDVFTGQKHSTDIMREKVTIVHDVSEQEYLLIGKDNNEYILMNEDTGSALQTKLYNDHLLSDYNEDNVYKILLLEYKNTYIIKKIII